VCITQLLWKTVEPLLARFHRDRVLWLKGESDEKTLGQLRSLLGHATLTSVLDPFPDDRLMRREFVSPAKSPTFQSLLRVASPLGTVLPTPPQGFVGAAGAGVGAGVGTGAGAAAGAGGVAGAGAAAGGVVSAPAASSPAAAALSAAGAAAATSTDSVARVLVLPDEELPATPPPPPVSAPPLVTPVADEELQNLAEVTLQ
jgi:hypothetical protein